MFSVVIYLCYTIMVQFGQANPQLVHVWWKILIYAVCFTVTVMCPANL
jgi:hypothetical protein